jgi:hypothetical protein
MFFSLVLWIALFVRLLEDLFTYVDDTYSWEFADNTLIYLPYAKHLPTKQTKLLQLFDELGIPHDKLKQVHGDYIDIIGFRIDANVMTITMPTDARSELIRAIWVFANPRQHWTLRDCQCLAGWINWALNAYPLLRPGLSSLYKKISHGTSPHSRLSINVTISCELHWLADHVENSSGIHILASQDWTESDADIVYYSDACPTGMGFWALKTCEGFLCQIPKSTRQPIFFFEALAVLSVLHHACMSTPRPTRVALFMDNGNTVSMFNSLHVLPPYNPILITAVDWLLILGMEIRVFFIPGHLNVVADVLSRIDTTTALHHEPCLIIRPFSPP